MDVNVPHGGNVVASCELLHRARRAALKHSRSLFMFTREAAAKQNESFASMSLAREGTHKRMSGKGRSGE